MKQYMKFVVYLEHFPGPFSVLKIFCIATSPHSVSGRARSLSIALFLIEGLANLEIRKQTNINIFTVLGVQGLCLGLGGRLVQFVYKILV